MVDIEYLPYQKIIVHEVRKMDINDLLSFVAAQVEAQKTGMTAVVNWVDGVAFVTGEFLPSPQTIEETLKGRIHYSMVMFSETSYQPEKRVTWNGRDYSIRMNRGDNNPNFIALTKFLRNFRS
ncbi:MAG TPA: hypothetical protein VLY21_04115 [Nitrososphaerales archaeon]|nr:hypothetical protein [Nitrososphaerales archaeon]